MTAGEPTVPPTVPAEVDVEPVTVPLTDVVVKALFVILGVTSTGIAVPPDGVTVKPFVPDSKVYVVFVSLSSKPVYS